MSDEITQTYRGALNWASSFLKKQHKEVQVAEWLMKERFQFSKTELVINYPKKLEEENFITFKNDIKEHALNDTPVQYIVGHEWFYERKFKVTSDTLIPRQETEEWFDRYIRSLSSSPLKVLDIGTGSGILAISHKLERPQDQVYAGDISKEALNIAAENANKLKADVTFRQGDLLTPFKESKFDLILSNPPYIGEEELNEMDVSVYLHEPKLALFADDEGLEIYKRLALESKNIIQKSGQMIFEIGYKQGQIVKDIFQEEYPEANIEIWKDMSRHDRAIFIQLK